MNRLGRMLAAALLALTVAVPGVAAAGGDNPLADLPPEFEPAVEAAADELGLSAGELKNSSREELQELVCAELDGVSSEELVTRVQDALDNLPKEQLEGLSEQQLSMIEGQLPTFISQLKSACEEAEEVADSDEASDDSADDDTPVPDRVDAGAGGVTGTTGTTAPVIFGGLFAALFGVFGIALVRTRRRA